MWLKPVSLDFSFRWINPTAIITLNQQIFRSDKCHGIAGQECLETIGLVMHKMERKLIILNSSNFQMSAVHVHGVVVGS